MKDIDNLYDGGFYNNSPHRPPRYEVEICKIWIRKFIDTRKNINTNHSSYGCKHFVEDWANDYIPNGAFIQAAIELGFKYRVCGPNAYFNMSFIRAEKAGLIPSYWNGYQTVKLGLGRSDPDLIKLMNANPDKPRPH